MLRSHLAPEPGRLATLWGTLTGHLPGWWRHKRSKPLAACALPYPPLAAPDGGRRPAFVSDSPVAVHCRQLLGGLDWQHFPERDAARAWPGVTPQRRAP